MPEPCPRCGAEHEGDCPPATADEAASASSNEACAFCGEVHPRHMSCGQWAVTSGGVTAAPWGSTGSPALPPRPTMPFNLDDPSKRIKRPPAAAIRVVVLCLALVGVISLARIVGGHFIGNQSGSVAALPACTHDRIRQNLVTATSIEAQSTSALDRRIDATNSLLLSSSDGCSEQVLKLYTAFIEYQALCLVSPATDACKNRDSAHASINQVVNDPQF